MGGQLGCRLPQHHDGPHEQLPRRRVARFRRPEGAAAAADASPSRKRPAASDDAATHAAKRPAPPPRCYCDRPAVRLGDRFVCPLPDTRNYCTFGREDRMRIVPRFGIPAALAPKPCN